jgi:hypothetical protein
MLDPAATLEAPPPAPALPSTPPLTLAPEPLPLGAIPTEAEALEAFGLNDPPPMITRPGEIAAPDPNAPPEGVAAPGAAPAPSPAPPAPAAPSPSPSPAGALPATSAALARRGRGAPGGSAAPAPAGTPAPAGAPSPFPARPYAGLSATELEQRRIRAESEPVLEAQANNLIAERLRGQELNDQLRAQTLARDRARQRADSISRMPINPERYVDDMSFGDTVGAVLAAVFAGLSGRPEVFHNLLNDRITRDLQVQKERKSLLYQQAVATLGSEEAALEALKARALNHAAGVAAQQAELGTLNAQQDGQLRAAGIIVEQQARAAQLRAQQLAIEAHGKTQQALAEYAGKKAIDRQYAAPRGAGDAGVLQALKRHYGITDKQWEDYQKAAGAVRVADAGLDDLERYVEQIAPDDNSQVPGYFLGGRAVPNLIGSAEGNSLRQRIAAVVTAVLEAQGGVPSDADVERATGQVVGDGTGRAIRQGLKAQRTTNRRTLEQASITYPGAADAARDLSTLRTRRAAQADPNRGQWHSPAGGR